MKNFPDVHEEEEWWFSLKDLQEYNLGSLPKLLSILIDNGLQEIEDFPLTKLTKVGEHLELEVTKMLRPEEFWNYKHTALQFAKAIVKGANSLNDKNFRLQHADYDDLGNEDGVCVWWKLIVPLNTSLAQVEKSIVKSVDIAFNQALNFLEGLSSVLILGKDNDEHFQKLKIVASAVEESGYNPIIIKEKEDILGETVIQKVLRYGLQSKFIVIENTESSGHLYEIPHVVKMAEKIAIILQENGKGATWMFEEMYFNLKTVKRFRYDNGAIEGVLKESFDWANETFDQLCEYQTKELPWLKNK